jgi:hypothetical protein
MILEMTERIKFLDARHNLKQGPNLFPLFLLPPPSLPSRFSTVTNRFFAFRLHDTPQKKPEKH